MRRFIILLIFGALALTVGCSAPTATTSLSSPSVSPQVVQLDPAEFAAQLPERLTINVHIPNEGSLPDTDMALPYNEIAARQTELPADHATAIAIYCMTGNMSAIAGQTLTGLGYTDVVELRGGMEAWQAAGLPLLPAA